MARRHTGIRARHARRCVSRDGGSCNCRPSYEASIWSQRDGRKLRKTFATEAAARAWRSDAASALRRGKLAAPSRETVKQAGLRWLEKAKAGEIRARSGKRYKPSVLRTYEGDLKRYVFPELGHVRLSELRRRDVQEGLVDQLVGRALSGSKVRNVIMPLRAIVRRALEDDELAVNPTSNLRLPEVAKGRDRAASPEEAQLLLDALAEEDRPLWATAFYAGLRRGELRALRWSAIDDEVTVIRVEHGWDDVEGEIDPKSDKGTRTVPVAGVVRLLLLEHKARTGRRGEDLVFGSTGDRPFTPSNIRKRALRAWARRYRCGCNVDANEEATLDEEGARICPEHGVRLLEPIGLHEARHTYVSLMHDAGFSLERIGDYVGHSSTYMTDRYRHLLEGHEAEAAARFDEYLARRTGAHTGAQASVVPIEAARLSGK